MITITSWAENSIYATYATFTERRCEGYGLPSSPHLPGGGVTVDCVGNCATGAGYCYASSDGQSCANCLLWGEDATICSDFGMPQGGPVPGTSAWDGNPHCNMDAWTAGGGDDRAAIWASCTNRLEYSNAKLRVVQGEEVLYTSQVTAVTSDGVGTAVAYRLLCIDTYNSPHLTIGAEASLTAQEFSRALELAECQSNDNITAWGCDGVIGLGCDVSSRVFSQADT